MTHKNQWPFTHRLQRIALQLSATLLLAACSTGTEPEPAPVVAEVIVAPAQLVLPEGDLARYSARLIDRYGQAVDGVPVTWTTSNPHVGTVSAEGVVTTHAVGTVVISAHAAGKTGSGSLEVTRAPVATVELRPATLELAEGQVTTVIAIARDRNGRDLPDRVATWTTTNPAIASVSAAGIVSAHSSGTTTLRVTIETEFAELRLTVAPAAVALVQVSPGALVLEIGEQRQMTAVLKDARGNILQGRPVTWSVQGNATSISPTGKVTGIRNGYATILATSEGVVGAVGATVALGEATGFELLYYRYSPPGAMELFTLAPGTGEAPTRINAGTVSHSPTASPDGRRVAFAVAMNLPTGERVEDIFAVDRTGMNMKRLTSLAGTEDSPAWSPTGGAIAFHHWDVHRSDIWVMSEDGSAPMNLTADMPASGFRGEPAWSHDGTRIAFSQLENGPGVTSASIWVMNADGSDKRRITISTNGFDASPTWSPDGDRLAFMRFFAGEADITIIDITTGTLNRIRHAGLEGKPAWSPDGRWIAFSADPQNNLYIIAPDGTGLRLLTVDPAWGGGLAPAWIRHR